MLPNFWDQVEQPSTRSPPPCPGCLAPETPWRRAVEDRRILDLAASGFGHVAKRRHIVFQSDPRSPTVPAPADCPAQARVSVQILCGPEHSLFAEERRNQLAAKSPRWWAMIFQAIDK